VLSAKCGVKGEWLETVVARVATEGGNCQIRVARAERLFTGVLSEGDLHRPEVSAENAKIRPGFVRRSHPIGISLPQHARGVADIVTET
jgi:hypothetical protein